MIFLTWLYPFKHELKKSRAPFFSHEKSLSFLHTTSESKGLSRKHKKYIFWSDAVSEAAAAAEAIEKKDEVGRRNED